MNDIDEQIAIRVFGLTKKIHLDTFNNVSWSAYKNETGKIIDWRGEHDRWGYIYDLVNPGDELSALPSFSTDMNWALRVLIELEQFGIKWSIDAGSWVSFLAKKSINYWGLIETIHMETTRDTAMAICRGALKVINYLEGKNVESTA